MSSYAFSTATRFETSGNWSGAYITANRSRQFLQVWGMWRIPDHLKIPPPPQKGLPDVPYVCSNWIGLDEQRRYLDSSLPQIGTGFHAGGGWHDHGASVDAVVGARQRQE